MKIPGLESEVFFQAPDEPERSWRDHPEADSEPDDEDTPVSDEQHELLIGMLGFDPRELWPEQGRRSGNEDNLQEADESYFVRCERDEGGRCKPEGEGEDTKKKAENTPAARYQSILDNIDSHSFEDIKAFEGHLNSLPASEVRQAVLDIDRVPKKTKTENVNLLAGSLSATKGSRESNKLIGSGEPHSVPAEKGTTDAPQQEVPPAAKGPQAQEKTAGQEKVSQEQKQQQRRAKITAKHERLAQPIKDMAGKIESVEHPAHQDYLEIVAGAMHAAALPPSKGGAQKAGKQQAKEVKKLVKEKISPYFSLTAQRVANEITQDHGVKVGRVAGRFLKSRAKRSASILADNAEAMILDSTDTYQASKADLVGELTGRLEAALEPKSFLKTLADDEGFDFRASDNQMVEELKEEIIGEVEFPDIPEPDENDPDSLDAYYDQVEQRGLAIAQEVLGKLYQHFLGDQEDPYFQAASLLESEKRVLEESESYFVRCERDDGGQCLPEGKSGDKEGKGKENVIVQEKKGVVSKSRDIKIQSMKHLPVDNESRKKFLETGAATAFRIHNATRSLPKESANMWTDSDEDTMPGVSGYANMSNALADMIFGERESVTGENYTSAVADSGGEPAIVVLDGKYIDGPGAEVVVPEPRIAAVITRQQAEQAFRDSLYETLTGMVSKGANPEDARNLSLEDLADKYSPDSSDIENVEQLLMERLRQG